MAETDLYAPVKQFLEAQGYAVKGEIGACDVVGVRGAEDAVVVELKERLNFALLLQAVDRLNISPLVYVAFRIGKGQSATWRSRRKQVLSLFRRLGLGLLTVSSRGNVVAVLDPTPYSPRTNARRSSRQRLTAYRQDALRCARELSSEGTLKVNIIRERADVERAGPILRDNHYGWFERVKTGYYDLSPKGQRDLADWSEVLDKL